MPDVSCTATTINLAFALKFVAVGSSQVIFILPVSSAATTFDGICKPPFEISRFALLKLFSGIIPLFNLMIALRTDIPEVLSADRYLIWSANNAVRIVDFNEHQTFMQQLFSMKTITIFSGDRSTPSLDIIGVKANNQIVPMIRERVIISRRNNSIYEITNR